MARWAIETAERDGLRVVAVCPFVRAYIRRHARHRDIGSSLTN
jgi:predicted GNAT family acetyltransferase